MATFNLKTLQYSRHTLFLPQYPRLEEGTGMTTAQVGYAPVHRWVKSVLGNTHTTVVITVAWAVLCLLVAQRVTPAALARA